MGILCAHFRRERLRILSFIYWIFNFVFYALFTVFCVSAERHLWVNKRSFVYVLRNAEAHTFTSDANVVCQILSGKEVDTDDVVYYTYSAF